VSGHILFIVELGLVFGLVLAWAVWELWSLDRDKRRRGRDASAERAGHAEGEQRADPR